MNIKRYETYTLDLTGEQLAWILLLTGNTNGGWDQKEKLYLEMFDIFKEPEEVPTIDLSDISRQDRKAEINRWLDELFADDVNSNLKELKDQYLSLGEKIKKLEEKLYE